MMIPRIYKIGAVTLLRHLSTSHASAVTKVSDPAVISIDCH